MYQSECNIRRARNPAHNKILQISVNQLIPPVIARNIKLNYNRIKVLLGWYQSFKEKSAKKWDTQ